MILVAIPLPKAFSRTVSQLESSQQRYFELAHERGLTRPDLPGLASAADHDGALRNHMAGAISLQAGDSATGGFG